MNKLLYASALALTGLAFCTSASAFTAGSGPMARVGELAPSSVEHVWHSGLPHRRVVGDRVYGGRCPPQGCPLWTQRDITPDPYTGRYRYYAAPRSQSYGPGTYAAPGGGYRYIYPTR